MPQLKIVTWNINSVRIRMNIIRRLVKAEEPDVICLQETKCIDDSFPAKALKKLGYVHQVINGQKGYHGVAVVSRVPLEKIEAMDLCGVGHARHLSVRVPGNIELHNFYVPAGGDIPDPDANPKFAHKLKFIEEMEACFGRRGDKASARAILVGDLNVAPLENDVWSHKQLLKVVSHTPAETTRFTRMHEAFDWIDVTRRFVPAEEKIYSWWSYRNQDWRKSDRGRRLDHIWVSRALGDAVADHKILRNARSWRGPSDHVPVLATVQY
jgi:exodeoxyribonuclease-3